MNRTRIGIVIVVLGLALSACAADASTTSAYQLEAPPAGVMTGHVTLLKEYTAVESIEEDAALVLMGTLLSSREVEVHDLPFTVSTLKVERVIQGEFAGETVDIRYTGGATLNLPELPSIPRKGLHYLVALQPFTFDGKTPTGEYVVVGPGQWVRAQTSQPYTLDVWELYAHRDESLLPIEIASERLETILRGNS